MYTGTLLSLGTAMAGSTSSDRAARLEEHATVLRRSV